MVPKKRFSRPKFAIYSLIGAAAFTLSLAALFTLLDVILPPESDRSAGITFLRLVWGMFLFFSAPVVAAAFLLLFTKVPDDLTYGYGCALYYGPMVLAELFRELGMYPGWPPYAAALLVVSLVCYIVWLKMFREEYEERKKYDQDGE